MKNHYLEDWFVYAEDEFGNVYYVNTELWRQWGHNEQDTPTMARNRALVLYRAMSRIDERWHLAPQYEGPV